MDGDVLDLSHLNERELAFLRRCYRAFRDDMNWADFANLVEQSENPLIAATGGWITRQVMDHPLFQAAQDLMYRLWFRQGKLSLRPGQDPETPPFPEETAPAAQEHVLRV
jgi:hypothetical protein